MWCRWARRRSLGGRHGRPWRVSPRRSAVRPAAGGEVEVAPRPGAVQIHNPLQPRRNGEATTPLSIAALKLFALRRLVKLGSYMLHAYHNSPHAGRCRKHLQHRKDTPLAGAMKLSCAVHTFWSVAPAHMVRMLVMQHIPDAPVSVCRKKADATDARDCRPYWCTRFKTKSPRDSVLWAACIEW